MLVAKTLLCLADLVPILGSAVVIGGNRSKIFADGRPQGIPDAAGPWSGVRSITPVIGSGEFLSGSPVPDAGGDNSASFTSVLLRPDNFNAMPERLSPEGEDIYRTNNSDVELEVDEWSDWENDGSEVVPVNHLRLIDTGAPEPIPMNGVPEDTILAPVPIQPITTLSRESSTESKGSKQPGKGPAESIERLDIKTQPTATRKPDAGAGEEFDFFKDMEPVIQKANVLLIDDETGPTKQQDDGGQEANKIEQSGGPAAAAKEGSAHELNEREEEEIPLVSSSRLEIKVDDSMATTEDGWGDEDDDDEGNGGGW